MSSAICKLATFAAVAISFIPATCVSAWELSGTKTIFVTAADGTRTSLGSVDFTPTTDGAATFKIKLDSAPFGDHFLSMREFKCLQGNTELTCHVPYPHASPRTVKIGNLAWLEHSLLFFYKLPTDFGAKLWNGIYFELRPTDSGLIGKPQAIDLNLIAAPPANTNIPPYRSSLRDDMPTGRWIKSLSIE